MDSNYLLGLINEEILVLSKEQQKEVLQDLVDTLTVILDDM